MPKRPPPANSSRAQSAAVHKDDSDVQRRKVKETEEKRAQVRDTLRKVEETAQNRDVHELAVAKGTLATLEQENAKQRSVRAPAESQALSDTYISVPAVIVF